MTAWLGLEANGSTGALVPAVAVSVALHVAVLAGVPDPATYADDAPRAPLNARLAPQLPPEAEPSAPVAAPLPQAEEPRASRAEAQPRAERRVAPPPRPAPSAAPAPAPPVRPVNREEIAAAPTPDAPAAPAPVLAARAESATAVGGEPSLAPRAGPADVVDAGSLGQYRLALLGAARRHKLYPEVARERGWEGRVAVELVIGADGALASASVKQSSGHGLLDREALEMLKRAAALTSVPPALKGREFRLDVPVLFELRNG